MPSIRPVEIGGCFQPVLCEMVVYDMKCASEVKCQYDVPSTTDVVLQK